MSHKFRGTGVALVTPFTADGQVDFDALKRVVNHTIEGGVNFLVALGTTAETPTLSKDEKAQVLATIIEANNGRVPVVCGVGGNNTAEVVRQLKENNLEGVDGILTVVPYYNKPTQEGMYQHFKAIAETTDKDIILYNVPGRTVANMLPTTTLRLANEFKHIVAVKEASGNMAQCMEIINGAPEHFAVLSGDDDLVMPQIACGMQGVISVAANCFTKDFTDMVNSALEGDFATSRSLHYKLLVGIRLLFAEGNPAGVKCVLEQMELCGCGVRLPLVKASKELHNNIKNYL
ncbi:MAG: 4-hydroxy-tetrahydrodipicolinate synthase [Chitinophagales bacterium]|nr:4-hydroxy-tetrahydrodipicolinate synthase [Chitinophagaceae bacterium]MCB9063779.1 4-hydroxy-tetrahydrodipicolinate synthase [Chitinophagales bacterium]